MPSSQQTTRNKNNGRLESLLSRYPALEKQLEEAFEVMDDNECTADEAEGRVIPIVNAIGAALLQGWSENSLATSNASVSTNTHKLDVKKNSLGTPLMEK